MKEIAADQKNAEEKSTAKCIKHQGQKSDHGMYRLQETQTARTWNSDKGNEIWIT